MIISARFTVLKIYIYILNTVIRAKIFIYLYVHIYCINKHASEEPIKLHFRVSLLSWSTPKLVRKQRSYLYLKKNCQTHIITEKLVAKTS